jgi:hypothetical protein
VHVGVAHCLTGGGPIVDPDVESVGAMLADELSAHPSDQRPEVSLLLRPEREDALDVASRHDKV